MSLGISNDDPNPYRHAVYGYEVVLPLKIQILSLQVALAAKMT